MEETKMISVRWNIKREASNTKQDPEPVENNREKNEAIENKKSEDSKDHCTMYGCGFKINNHLKRYMKTHPG